MSVERYQIDAATLLDRLGQSFRRAGAGSVPVAITEREDNIYGSTHPSEVVTCRLNDGTTRRILCKYPAAPEVHYAYGHREGVAYEADVYRQVLAASGATTPFWYGECRDETGRFICLAIECVDEGIRLTKSPDPAAIRRAAEWLGDFHARGQAMLADRELSFLKQYDESYYAGWAQRAADFASRAQGPAWLPKLCHRYCRMIDHLTSEPQTIIHGECYPDNVLVSAAGVFPIDWEAAAMAAGEIDLAGLTEGWDEAVVRECESAYRRCRWPKGAPQAFDTRLSLARLYLHFRWLGEKSNHTQRILQRAERNKTGWPLRQMKRLAQRLGLVC